MTKTEKDKQNVMGNFAEKPRELRAGGGGGGQKIFG